ncbi:MAG: hypothetical protein NC420_04685 [Eubacterium sp.]|nr:hypothetical protein [Eubacterium sp.]MCM1240874.1 hypothetical protein [Lachnospiraceae bacterium]MCM1304741.1 hypothetical protein [Butyrivibrio sp.]MCM1342390.1 hypothetical protein [Muribaculaceae bacterium]MCM1409283.1 hypothetical protein [Lachnospiraceae bacterium]
MAILIKKEDFFMPVATGGTDFVPSWDHLEMYRERVDHTGSDLFKRGGQDIGKVVGELS